MPKNIRDQSDGSLAEHDRRQSRTARTLHRHGNPRLTEKMSAAVSRYTVAANQHRLHPLRIANGTPGELLQEIRKVYSGRKGIQPQLLATLAEHIGDDPLTAREVEVLAQVARGNRNRDIGMQLFISKEAVKGHLKHIREKLGAKDRTEAIAIAVRRGIIRL